MQAQTDTMSIIDRLLLKKKFIQQTTETINNLSKQTGRDQYDLAIQGMNTVVQNMMKM